MSAPAIRQCRCGRFLPAIAAVLGLAALSPGAWSAALDMFFKLDGIDGESTDPGYSNWSRAISVGAIAVTNGGMNPVMTVTVRKTVDRASPAIMLACAKGTPIPKATIVFRTANEPKSTLYRIVLGNVTIASDLMSGNDQSPVESVAMNFTRIEWEYTLEDGTFGQVGHYVAFWDSVTGAQGSSIKPPFRASFVGGGPGATFVISWPGEQGHRYRVMASPTLKGGDWTPHTDVLTAGADGPMSANINGTPRVLFLRVDELE